MRGSPDFDAHHGGRNRRLPCAALDIDGNGQVEALTDGVLTLRYLLGLRGDALVAGATGACASRDTAAIEAYLAARVVP